MLKSIDLTYGFNGEVSTASVSYSGSNIAGQAVPTGSPVNIDAILNGYRVFKTSTTNEAGFLSTSEEYVDEGAQKLEAIAVLVRGVTASPYMNWQKFYGKMYNFAETDLVTIGDKGQTTPKKVGNVLILGRTISVVTASDGNDQYYKHYAGGVKTGQSPKGVFPDEVEEKFTNLDVSASLKYGYYLVDLRAALTLCGYTLFNYPSDDSFALMETGGSLRDCISSVASTYGLYWMCRGYNITFYTRNEIASIANSIQDLTTSSNDNIVSASYSRDLFGKTKIGVIRGSASETESPSGGSSSGGARNKRVFFGKVNSELIVGADKNAQLILISKLYSFFMFSGGEEVFNLIFFIKILTDAGFRNFDIIKQYLENNHVINPKPKILEKFTDAEQIDILKYTKKDNIFYNLATTEGNAELPTRTNIYQILKSVCESLNSIYISKPVSKRTAKKYALTPTDGFRVSEGYPAQTLVSEIPELSAYFTSISSFIIPAPKKALELTIGQLSRLVNLFGDDFVLREDAHFYVATKDFREGAASFEQAEIDSKKVISPLVPMPSIPLEILDKKLLATSDIRNNAVSAMFASSEALVGELAQKAKPDLIMFAVKLADPEKDDTGSSEDLSNDEKQELLGSSEIKSFGVNVFDAGDLATADIVTFDCNVDEASFLQQNFELLVPQSVPQIASNVSYMGFVTLPLTDPSISSYGIVISDSSVKTTIGYSTKEIIGVDQSIIMAGYTANGSKNITKQFKSRQKNFLGLN